jgi:uncharacterized protein YeaO (DUF488 family)
MSTADRTAPARTLVYATRDEEHNSAVVLKRFLDNRMK